MKDSLILEGKVYISAGRAAKLMNYAQDYIGQLCRLNKLDCKMVGRSWFVTEESLMSHRESTIDSIQERVSKIIENKREEEKQKQRLEKEKESAKKEAEKASLLRYEPVKDFLLPELRKKVPSAFSMPSSMAGVAVSPSFYFDAKKESLSNTFFIIVFVASMVMSALIFSASYSPDSRLLSQASISSVANEIVDGVRRGFSAASEKLFSYLSGTEKNIGTDKKNDSIDSAPMAEPTLNGMAVAPSSGSVESDAEMKERIKNSFSDEVVVRPDASGTAGVVTPVFKSKTGNDFVYVLVPVKEKN